MIEWTSKLMNEHLTWIEREQALSGLLSQTLTEMRRKIIELLEENAQLKAEKNEIPNSHSNNLEPPRVTR